jgi:hypothetical protein
VALKYQNISREITNVHHALLNKNKSKLLCNPKTYPKKFPMSIMHGKTKKCQSGFKQVALSKNISSEHIGFIESFDPNYR